LKGGDLSLAVSPIYRVGTDPQLMCQFLHRQPCPLHTMLLSVMLSTALTLPSRTKLGNLAAYGSLRHVMAVLAGYRRDIRKRESGTMRTFKDRKEGIAFGEAIMG
jgi:hypothetical protein